MDYVFFLRIKKCLNIDYHNVINTVKLHSKSVWNRFGIFFIKSLTVADVLSIPHRKILIFIYANNNKMNLITDLCEASYRMYIKSIL